MNTIIRIKHALLGVALLAAPLVTPTTVMAQSTSVEVGARVIDPSRNNDRAADSSRDSAASSSSNAAGRVDGARGDAAAQENMTPATVPQAPIKARERNQPRRTNTKKPRPTVDNSNMAGIVAPQPRNQNPAAPSSM